ncbi:hypothetical protein JCM33374_g1674 [Metschnikowia sp. JCM 33374]|nr:hypothetical protein JCM33374_g1674 [Metschnikowia sp. JCM 33374]
MLLNQLIIACIHLPTLLAARVSAGNVQVSPNQRGPEGSNMISRMPKRSCLATSNISDFFIHSGPQDQTLASQQHPIRLARLHNPSKSPVDEFVCHLKSFVSGDTFDVLGFEHQESRLRKELREIEIAQKTSRSFDETSQRQLKFASDFLSRMVNSVSYLKHYSRINAPGNRLLYKVIELNVRAWALCDSHGVLDRENKETSDKVHSLKSNLNFWKGRFDGLPNVHHGTRRMFRDYYTHVSKVLRTLQGQIPRAEYYFFSDTCHRERPGTGNG